MKIHPKVRAIMKKPQNMWPEAMTKLLLEAERKKAKPKK